MKKPVLEKKSGVAVEPHEKHPHSPILIPRGYPYEFQRPPPLDTACKRVIPYHTNRNDNNPREENKKKKPPPFQRPQVSSPSPLPGSHSIEHSTPRLSFTGAEFIGFLGPKVSSKVEKLRSVREIRYVVSHGSAPTWTEFSSSPHQKKKLKTKPKPPPSLPPGILHFQNPFPPPFSPHHPPKIATFHPCLPPAGLLEPTPKKDQKKKNYISKTSQRYQTKKRFFSKNLFVFVKRKGEENERERKERRRKEGTKGRGGWSFSLEIPRSPVL